MSKWYGNLTNRLEEGHNYSGKELAVGTDITMYYWSDRSCYFITKVVDQKHIFVKRYEVCADHHKAGGQGHQDWLYFKTAREMQEYTNKCVDEGLLPDYCKHNLEEIKDNSEVEWVFRYNHWYEVVRSRWGKPLEKPEYVRLQPISFGVRDYYYDWEF